MIAGAQGGAAAAGHMEQMLLQVGPGRFDAYENLLGSLAAGEVWMLLWHGVPGSADAQYGSMEINGHGYAPAAPRPGNWPPAAGPASTRWSPGGTSP